MLVCQEGVSGQAFPTHFNVAAESLCWFPDFLRGGTAPCVAVDLVCPQEEGVMGPPVLRLRPEPCFIPSQGADEPESVEVLCET